MIRFLKTQENPANRERGCGSNADSVCILATLHGSIPRSPLQCETAEETSRHRNTAGMKSPATHVANQTRSREASRLSAPARTAIIVAVWSDGADACLDHAH